MNDEATIRKNIELWVQQYNTHDAAALAAWYTKDCVYITPTGVALLGPEQILDYFQTSFTRSPKTSLVVQVESVRMEKPDLAVGHGRFEVTNALDPNGKPMPMKGPWVTTFLKLEGKWVPITHTAALTVEVYMTARA